MTDRVFRATRIGSPWHVLDESFKWEGDGHPAQHQERSDCGLTFLRSEVCILSRATINEAIAAGHKHALCTRCFPPTAEEGPVS